MKDLIVIGASGFGIEVVFLAERLGINVKGFLDDTPDKQNTEVLGTPVLGPISEWVNYDDCEFVIAIGSPRARKAVLEKMESVSRTPSFATLVDPNAIVGAHVTLGEGTIICAGVIATANISLGKHNIINLSVTIGHDCVFGDYVTAAPQAAISGNINLANLVEVGTGAVLREKLSVGHGAIVGMGSVLTKDVEPLSVVVGNPARALKKLEC